MLLEAYLSRDVLRESVNCGTVLGQSSCLERFLFNFYWIIFISPSPWLASNVHFVLFRARTVCDLYETNIC